MKINLRKLIADLLLTFVRDNRLIELIRVLTSQAETAFNQFNLQIPDWLYKINADASVISLQHHIKRELDVDAVITELDGKPIDFLVSVTGFVDEQRLKALIDSFKLSGKSYVFKVGNEIYTAKFGSWYCESLYDDNLLTSHFDTNHVWITSALDVTTELAISVQVTISGRPSQTHLITISNASSESDHLTIVDGSYFVSITEVVILSVSPVRDTYYNYIY